MTRKCLVYRGGVKKGQVIRIYYHVQSKAWDNDCWSNKVIEEPCLMKNRCPTEAWIVLHGLFAQFHQSRYPLSAWKAMCGLLVWSNELKGPGLIKDRYPLTWTVPHGLLAWSNEVIGKGPDIKDRYHTEPWVVLHGWPIEPMAMWIWWVTYSLNIGTDWSPIADCPTIGPDFECCRCVCQALSLTGVQCFLQDMS